MVCKGNHIDLSRATIYKSDTSPYNIHHLPHDQIHTIAVRFVTETGLTSELSSGILYNFIEGRLYRLIICVLQIVRVILIFDLNAFQKFPAKLSRKQNNRAATNGRSC